MRVCFLLLRCIIYTSYSNSFCQSNLFCDCANGFVDIFCVHNDFNRTNNFIRFLSFTYCFDEINVDVSYDGDRNFSELRNKSKPGRKGSNKNAIFIFLFLTSSFFHLLIKQKPDVRVKIISLPIFLFIGISVKHLQRPAPHHDINICSQLYFFTTELINNFESLYTSHLHSQSVFLSVSQLKYYNSNWYY